MRHNLILFLLGWLTAILSALTLIPTTIALLTGELTETIAFLSTMIAGSFTAGVMILTGRKSDSALGQADLCLITTLSWILGALLASLPLWLSLQLSFAKAYFLAASALTTTGASLFHEVNTIAVSIRLWLALLQWTGGLATLLMAILILAPLGIGGMQLRQIAGTTNIQSPLQSLMRALKIITPLYASLTLTCLILLLISGLPLFEAICFSLSTISTGGMPLADDTAISQSATLKSILIIFMLAGSINMTQYYLLMRGRSNLKQNLEQQAYLIMIAIVTIALTSFLLEEKGSAQEETQTLFISGWGEILFDPRWRNALGESLFAATSIMSTTFWHPTDIQLPFILTLLLTFIGGMTISTAGGLKIMRVLLLFRQNIKELSVLAYPHDVKTIYFENRLIDHNLMQTVWVFFASLNAAIAILMLILASTGLSFEQSLAAAVAAISNAGPMLNMIGMNSVKLYAELPDTASWAMSLGMIAGRMELLAFLSLLLPLYWKRR